MTNEEQLDILKQGFLVWNQWRKANHHVKIELDGADLRGVDLRQVNLNGALLRGADLSEVHLTQAKLAQAELTQANLRFAQVDLVDLTRANLTDANLESTSLQQVKLYQAQLRNAQLFQAHLWNADLTEADLYKVNLNRGDLRKANLTRANLIGARLREANLEEAVLREANFMGTGLAHAILRKADLTRANFTEAFLMDVDLTSANLTEAELSRTVLDSANLKGANLTQTNFSNSRAGSTIFGEIDFTSSLGLETIIHVAPSVIGTDVIKRSKGKIPVEFLRGCGLSDWEIEEAKLYDPDVSNEQVSKILYRIYNLRATQALQISPLFISYSHSDGEVVDKISKALAKKGVRYWRDIHEMKAGRIEKQIDRAIRQNPTVLLVLSEHSINSDWVEHEVRTARAVEKEMKQDVICPIALDDSWKSARWPQHIMEQIIEYNILDFSAWQDDSRFDDIFQKLIDGLELFYD